MTNIFFIIGQKIYKTLFRNRPAERNELFQPGRMVSYPFVSIATCSLSKLTENFSPLWQITLSDGLSIYTQAYVFDVEDEYAESDIPTTLIRSKADCPGIEVRLFKTILPMLFVQGFETCKTEHCVIGIHSNLV